MARSRWLRIVRGVTAAQGGDAAGGADGGELAEQVEVGGRHADRAGVGEQHGQLLARTDPGHVGLLVERPRVDGDLGRRQPPAGRRERAVRGVADEVGGDVLLAVRDGRGGS